jgi:hypothetical protein
MEKVALEMYLYHAHAHKHSLVHTWARCEFMLACKDSANLAEYTNTHVYTYAYTHHILHDLYGLLLGGVLGSLHRDVVRVIFDLLHKLRLVGVGLREGFFQPFDLLQYTTKPFSEYTCVYAHHHVHSYDG